MSRLLVFALTVLAFSLLVRAEESLNFSRDVRPILSDNCFKCHGPDANARKGDLRLDLDDAKLGPYAPRDGYSIVVPKNVEESLLISRITSDDPEYHMPPVKSGKKLTAQQIETLKKWISQGAKWGKHWSFEKISAPAIPDVVDKSWCRNVIDNFILARLEKEHIRPSSRAPRYTLFRRAALDLTGLPPSPGELDGKQTYEEYVDHLIASSHFGECQARHWLDAARYADSNGYSLDFPRSIWPYRDYVINAMNADMPFDQFTIEQIAGDLLPNATLQQKIATGFHRNSQFNAEGGIDKEQFRVEAIVDRVATTGTVFLGLTLACAQCHDHKFDPISQREYYRFFAFFNNCDEPTLNVAAITETAERDKISQRVAELENIIKQKTEVWEKNLTEARKHQLKKQTLAALAVPETKRTDKQRSAIEAAVREADNDFGALVEDLKALRNQLKEGASTLVMAVHQGAPRQTHILIKGDFTRPSDEVTPGVPEILPPLHVQRVSSLSTAPSTQTALPTRLDLARWIASPDNPLTARVIVNRIWQQYFGRGLVETENDFGSQGTQPSNPELLDYLASQLISHHWSLKYIHRLIVTSATYQQSSNARPDLENIDPYNHLLARQSRLRLDAEIVRDVALSASGLLSEKIGGPSVYPPIPDGVLTIGQINHPWPTSTGPDRYRRGMYTFTFRNSLHPSLGSFDAPQAVSACTRRLRSNTPLQALNLLNDAAWMEFSRALARRAIQTLDHHRGAYAFQLATSRWPTDDEEEVMTDLFVKFEQHLKEHPEEVSKIASGQTPKEIVDDEYFASWTLLARAILNLDETITRE